MVPMALFFKMKKVFFRLFLVVLMLSLAAFVGGCTGEKKASQEKNADGARNKGLPGVVVWTTYDVGTGAFTQAAAIADAITKTTGVRIRNLPSGNDIGRLTPLRSGNAHFAFLSAATNLFAYYGMYDFANYEWGPQPVRQVYTAVIPGTIPLATAADANIKSFADLKGKRVYKLIGGPAINVLHEAWLAFAGLTWNDVKVVEVPGLGSAYKGFVEGKIDWGVMNANSPVAFELEASPRGIAWLPFPDPTTHKEEWARMLKVAPYIMPKTVPLTIGAGVKADKPVPVTCYPYPVVTTYEKTSDELVYFQVKAICENFDNYKGSFPDGPYWDIKNITADTMTIPYHNGAIKYFKEIGVWNDQMQQKQDKLLVREKELKDLWAKTIEEATSKGISATEFMKVWMEKASSFLKV